MFAPHHAVCSFTSTVSFMTFRFPFVESELGGKSYTREEECWNKLFGPYLQFSSFLESAKDPTLSVKMAFSLIAFDPPKLVITHAQPAWVIRMNSCPSWEQQGSWAGVDGELKPPTDTFSWHAWVTDPWQYLPVLIVLPQDHLQKRASSRRILMTKASPFVILIL